MKSRDIPEIPGNPDIDIDYSGLSLQYPMDKALITEHLKYFQGLGFEYRWLSEMTTMQPTIKFTRDNVVITCKYWYGKQGTTCKMVPINKTIETYEKVDYEWVCNDAVVEEVVEDAT